MDILASPYKQGKTFRFYRILEGGTVEDDCIVLGGGETRIFLEDLNH